MPRSDAEIRASLEAKLAALKSARLKIALLEPARLVAAEDRDARKAARRMV
jgi:hypothetical protein